MTPISNVIVLRKLFQSQCTRYTTGNFSTCSRFNRFGSRYVSSKARELASKTPQISLVQSKANLKHAASKGSNSYKSYADTLALRSSPTLLYQAPSPTSYIAGCFLLGGFCFTWAAINFYSQYLYPADGTPAWVPVFVGGVCVAMTCFGTWTILGVRHAAFSKSHPY